jgi:hypothetical protein
MRILIALVLALGGCAEGGDDPVIVIPDAATPAVEIRPEIPPACPDCVYGFPRYGDGGAD